MESARARCLHTSCGVSEIEQVSVANEWDSDTKQRVCKHRTKHFPCCIVFRIHTEIVV